MSCVRMSRTPKIAARRVGLARALSKLGICSRSRAAEMIRRGEVRLDGVVKRDPETPVVLARDRIEVAGEQASASDKIYLMMNKPRGLVTTASDEKGRATIYELLKEHGHASWIAPVGRLDKASEGLLLLTNDSEWGARMIDPATHLEKAYQVQVGCVLEQGALQTIRAGVKSKDGELLRVKRASLLRSGQKNCWLEIVLDEGKNRQIRRIFESMEIEVLRLVRVAIGTLKLGALPKGQVRALSRDEKRALNAAMGKRVAMF